MLLKRGFSEAAFPKREKPRHKHLIYALQCTYKSRCALTWVRVDCGTSWPVGRLQIIMALKSTRTHSICTQLNSTPCQLVPKWTRPLVNSYPGENVFKWTRTQIKFVTQVNVYQVNSYLGELGSNNNISKNRETRFFISVVTVIKRCFLQKSLSEN